MSTAFCLFLSLLLTLPGDSPSTHDQHNWELFEPATPKDQKDFATERIIANLNATVPDEYILGPGDVVNIQVWQQADLSGTRTLGPDGVVTLPLVGDVPLGDKSRSGAQQYLAEAVSKFYKNPIVTLEVAEYHNNNVFVLGQLPTPGLMRITGRGTLLEVLTQVPSQMGVETTMSKCALIRGNDTIVWVDLHAMLRQGNLGLNLKLANNDVIYLPHEEEAMVYVMGEVQRPGAYRLKPGMSFLDGLMEAGGATLDGRKNSIELIRRQEGVSQRIRLKTRDLRNGDLSANVALAENDIIYVGRRPLAQISYFFGSLSPFSSLLVIEEIVSGDP